MLSPGSFGAMNQMKWNVLLSFFFLMLLVNCWKGEGELISVKMKSFVVFSKEQSTIEVDLFNLNTMYKFLYSERNTWLWKEGKEKEKTTKGKKKYILFIEKPSDYFFLNLSRPRIYINHLFITIAFMCVCVCVCKV